MTAAAQLKEQLLAFFKEAQQVYEHIFLVDFVKDPKTNEYSFIVDGTEAVKLSELAHISRLISRQIDEHILDDNAFRYQVTTPGADKPLVMPKQYFKHVGRTLSCQLLDETELEGEIKEVTEKFITLEIPGNKKKKIESTTQTVEFEQIKEAKIKLKF